MNLDRLETLCNGFGVSSAEGIVGENIRTCYEPLCDEILNDRLGSVFAVKRSKKENAKTLMIASPLDEPGMMISEVKENGELAFIQLESVASSSILHQRVQILKRDNTCVYGVVGIHKKAMEDKCEVKSTDELVIRCEKQGIYPGDLVSYAGNFSESDGIVISKALFPRVFNEVTIGLLERIKDLEFDFHIAIGCVAQSVIGFRGTKTATYVVKPNAAIALTAFDTATGKAETGKGIYLGYYDRQMLPSQRMLRDFEEVTGAKPHFGTMGNDGSFIHKTLKGTPAVSVGIAVDNLGTANEIFNVADGDALIDTLADYLKTLSSEKISAFGFGDEHD